jgi:hypothetical protein
MCLPRTEKPFRVSCGSCGYETELYALDRDDAISCSDSGHQQKERGMLTRCQGEKRRLVATPIAKLTW